MVAGTWTSAGAMRPSFVDGVASHFGFDSLERELMTSPLERVMDHAAGATEETVRPPPPLPDHDQCVTVDE